MKKKRVCIDVNPIVGLYVRGYLSGIGRTTLELVQALSQVENNTLDITLWSHNTKGIGVKNLPLLSGTHFFYPNRENWNKILGRFPIRELFTQYDLLHVTHNFEYVYAPQKTIVTLHDMILYTCPDEFAEEQRARAMSIVPPLMKKSKAVITCSEASKKDIVNYLQIAPEKVHVSHWGVRHDVFFPLTNVDELKIDLKNKYNIDRSYFFSVSCGYGRKNTLELLRNYLLFLKQNPSIDLVIIWKGYGNDAKELIEKANGRIHVLENISDEDLAKLYNLATATFYPSKYEGFGLPVLESMACGTPVVTSFNSSLPEVGGEAAIYIDADSQNGMCDIMCNFENHYYDIEDIRWKGIEQAAKFRWDKCARETLNIYSMMLNE